MTVFGIVQSFCFFNSNMKNSCNQSFKSLNPTLWTDGEIYHLNPGHSSRLVDLCHALRGPVAVFSRSQRCRHSTGATRMQGALHHGAFAPLLLFISGPVSQRACTFTEGLPRKFTSCLGVEPNIVMSMHQISDLIFLAPVNKFSFQSRLAALGQLFPSL